MRNRGRISVALCGLALTLGTHASAAWQSLLQSRDINRDGVVDAYYDTSLGITWLADSQAAAGSVFDDSPPFGPVGGLSWSSAMAWAGQLNVFGTTGWRLPSAYNAGTSNVCVGFSCIGSEMGHLRYVTLGNSGLVLQEAGPFLGLAGGQYWTSTTVESDSSVAWVLDFTNGAQGRATKLGWVYAWAVHDGDVLATVPEPHSLALVLLALGTGLLVTKRDPIGRWQLALIRHFQSSNASRCTDKARASSRSIFPRVPLPNIA